MSTEENKSNISLSVNDLSDNQLSTNKESVDLQQDEIQQHDVDVTTKGTANIVSELLHHMYNVSDISGNKSWFTQTEYIIFKSELKSVKKNNLVVLKECKENKRLLDLKYDDLNKMVNNIQTSVIFFSTVSGFLQATREQFAIPDDYISVISIFISTYISLLLSISKYYKLDETKERIQTLREKFSMLHNQLDYRMDVIGPWGNKDIWKHQDPKKKLTEWSKVYHALNTEYEEIIENKKNLVTEFEIIMDTKSRNVYHIKNRELNYKNRQILSEWDLKESQLEASLHKIDRRPPSMVLQHEELDNWGDDSDTD